MLFDPFLVRLEPNSAAHAERARHIGEELDRGENAVFRLAGLVFFASRFRSSCLPRRSSVPFHPPGDELASVHHYRYMWGDGHVLIGLSTVGGAFRFNSPQRRVMNWANRLGL